jgi:ABC-type transporter Mla maintaining outer membrane lipid asymmetry permease subunit MlaE
VASASAPTAAAVAASPSATAAFALWARLVDDECSSEKVLAVQSFNGLVCVRVVADLGKTEAARLPRKPIAKQGE